MNHHPSIEAGASQCDLILAELKHQRGEWVSLPLLAAASGSMAVHSRIADLRGRGLIIHHRNQRIGRKIHSSYRLTSGSAEQLPLL